MTNPAMNQLGVLVRVRGRERDRREQAFIAERREHESREAELRRRQEALAASQARHLAALRLRASSPGDTLLSEYLITQQAAVVTLSEDERQASEDVERSAESLAEARSAHHRAQVRLDVLEDQLAGARRQEARRLSRKQEAARPEGIPAHAVTI